MFLGKNVRCGVFFYEIHIQLAYELLLLLVFCLLHSADKVPTGVKLLSSVGLFSLLYWGGSNQSVSFGTSMVVVKLEIIHLFIANPFALCYSVINPHFSTQTCLPGCQYPDHYKPFTFQPASLHCSQCLLLNQYTDLKQGRLPASKHSHCNFLFSGCLYLTSSSYL